MTNSFWYVWKQLMAFIRAMIQGLDSALIEVGLQSLSTYQLDIKLLSETPILSVDIYTLLIWLCLTVAFFMIYKFFKIIIKLPFNFLFR